MPLDVRYHPEALAELRADVAWYEERGAGLGDRFEVWSTIWSTPFSNGRSRGLCGRVVVAGLGLPVVHVARRGTRETEHEPASPLVILRNLDFLKGMVMDRPRRALVVLTLLLAGMELVDAFYIEETAFAIGFAIVLGLLSWWAAKSRAVSPVVLIGLLSVMELVSVLFIYPNSDDPPAAWNTVLFALVTAATAVAAFTATHESWRARQSGPTPH